MPPSRLMVPVMPGLPVGLFSVLVSLSVVLPVYPAIVNPLAAVMGSVIVVVMALVSVLRPGESRRPSLEPPKFSVPPVIVGANAALDAETSARSARVERPAQRDRRHTRLEQERADRQPGGADGVGATGRRGVVLSLPHHVGGRVGVDRRGGEAGGVIGERADAVAAHVGGEIGLAGNVCHDRIRDDVVVAGGGKLPGQGGTGEADLVGGGAQGLTAFVPAGTMKSTVAPVFRVRVPKVSAVVSPLAVPLFEVMIELPAPGSGCRTSRSRPSRRRCSGRR